MHGVAWQPLREYVESHSVRLSVRTPSTSPNGVGIQSCDTDRIVKLDEAYVE